MKSIIKEIYYGNIHPGEMSFEKGSEYHQALEAVIEKQEKLMKSLDESQKEIFEEYIRAKTELSVLSAHDEFSYAFKLGALLSAEIFTGMDDFIVDI